MEPALRQLGLDPRRVLVLAKSKQMIVWEEVWGATNKQADVGDAVARVMEAIASGLWPPEGQESLSGRARAFARGLGAGVDQVPTTITPDA
jgi:hypothetical protein